MNVYDLTGMTVQSSEKRGQNVFHEDRGLKMRIVELPPGGHIPECTMSSHVIFHVLRGAVEVSVDSRTAGLNAGQCLVTGPATLSMATGQGVRLLGIQVAVRTEG